jgi:hypothetical protein
MARQRKQDVQFQIDRLERRHTELKERVAELGRRLSLTPSEQVMVASRKKEKLAAKDALSGLRRVTS